MNCAKQEGKDNNHNVCMYNDDDDTAEEWKN
jgi:hypothetical protein